MFNGLAWQRRMSARHSCHKRLGHKNAIEVSRTGFVGTLSHQPMSNTRIALRSRLLAIIDALTTHPPKSFFLH